jgi:uncharacterized protein YdaU (DUF1376 family)
MKPDCFMPYYGNDFEAATKGFGPEVKWAYLCALWHYWHHTHCQGLPNDDDMLRRICEVETASWARIRGSIFKAPFFELQNGLWQQNRARDMYHESVRIYNSRSAASRIANESRKGTRKRTVTDTVTECETGTVADPIHNHNHNHIHNQSQNHNQNQSISASQAPVGAPRVTFSKPTRAEAELYAAKLCFPMSELNNFYDHYESNGWKVGRVPMKDWQAAMRNWLKNYRAGTYASQQKPSPLQKPSLISQEVSAAAAHAERILKAIPAL